MSEPLFVIENIRQGSDCRIFWRTDGNGYTRILDEAWQLSEARARDICKSRPQEDIAQPFDVMAKNAVRHVPR